MPPSPSRSWTPAAPATALSPPSSRPGTSGTGTATPTGRSRRRPTPRPAPAPIWAAFHRRCVRYRTGSRQSTRASSRHRQGRGADMAPIRLRTPAIAAPGERSFWLQDIAAAAVTPPLVGSACTDVAIVGGGYTGLWTALRIREAAPGMRITILEADFCGSGASGRNGGQLHSWYAEIDRLSAVVGLDEALRLCAGTVEAIDELVELQRSGSIAMDLRLGGWMWTASARAQEGAWTRAVQITAAAGAARFRTLTAAEIARRCGSPVSYAGVVEEHAGTVHPAKLARGLRDLALARGVEIHESSPVRDISPGPPATLRTARGELRAQKVVLAANAWLAALPQLRRHLYVVDSQLIATEPIADRLDQMGWEPGLAICDAQQQVLYYQRSRSGRVVFGRGSGGIAFRGDFGAGFNRHPERGQHNVRELHRVYPGLAGVRVDHDWAGPIDCVPEQVPVFDHLAGHPDIVFGMGFNGSGIAQTPVAGRILASLVLGRKDAWSRSGLVGLARRARLPPEPWRYVGAQLVRQAIRCKNDAEIRNAGAPAWTRLALRLMPGSRGDR
ncbi:NAD(P)/FAD-dependent oxidoreductase [Verminephrobacter aporrectodeae]|uniref:NAD(P)/FAD-dependent oxidoreductase n=2 Tax=Verminephrobacter aporrectodeae TaxID=1110389 RepID=UPI0034DB7210